jgi:carbon monoxide dehydrogenase subunit G
MFKVKASYSEKLEVRADGERVRQFFADTRNFIELMPNIESIKTDADGTARWKIKAEIPLFGSLTETFSVRLAENNPSLIEYAPATTETKNFLRYSADIAANGAGTTTVQISQAVELRRGKATELHLLAGLAGEKLISQQMQQRVEKMIKTFLAKAKEKLEKK